MEIEKVGVLGCGLMGSGVAQEVYLRSLPERRNRASL
jgi:3-hydroxyacyl-CoA dehydrogenase